MYKHEAQTMFSTLYLIKSQYLFDSVQHKSQQNQIGCGECEFDIFGVSQREGWKTKIRAH